MFTGIVREIGTIHAVRRRPGVAVLEIDAPGIARDVEVGDSVAVNGVCLTATHRHGDRFRVDLSPETLRTTTAARWRSGSRVHLEPSLRAADRLGGHFVLGHVDGVGRLEAVKRLGTARQVTVAAAPSVLAQLLPKGSVAVDGVSLTLDAGPFLRSFTVTLIPETLRETRLAALGTGDLVNLEVDVLAKAGRNPALGFRLSAPGGTPPDTAGSQASRVEGRTGLSLQDIKHYGWK
jgi:riboflavin synthase